MTPTCWNRNNWLRHTSWFSVCKPPQWNEEETSASVSVRERDITALPPSDQPNYVLLIIVWFKHKTNVLCQFGVSLKNKRLNGHSKIALHKKEKENSRTQDLAQNFEAHLKVAKTFVVRHKTSHACRLPPTFLPDPSGAQYPWPIKQPRQPLWIHSSGLDQRWRGGLEDWRDLGMQ